MISRQICVSSAACRKNLAAAGPEKFSEEYIKKQIDQFNIGKRHLANMMGEDPETLTQEDIDVRHIIVLACAFWALGLCMRRAAGQYV